LTARTAFEDFHNQTHIVLGKGLNCSEEQVDVLENFYKKYYGSALVSRCTSLESESMKIFCNSYYSVKVQFFTELYLTCKNNGSDYEKIKDMMIKNSWINPMHTTIPGPDGQISYGGLCFPKDTNALLKYMEKNDLPRQILKSTIEERNEMRDDHDNCN
jgi:UDPglucose 6-dehydrogenase